MRGRHVLIIAPASGNYATYYPPAGRGERSERRAKCHLQLSKSVHPPRPLAAPPRGRVTFFVNLSFLQKHSYPFFVGRNDIQQAVTVHVRNLKLCSDTGVRVDEFWHKIHKTVRLFLGPKPNHFRIPAGAWLGATVRPPPLACDQVFVSVAIDIDEVRSMHFRSQAAKEFNLFKDWV